jgi:cytochrome c-type biogenesis protein CcmE
LKRKIWFIIIGAVVVVGIIIAVFPMVMHSGSGALAVTGLKAQAQTLQGAPLWIKGEVAAGSITRDSATQSTNFALSDSKESLNVTYKGIVPDEFKPGSVVEIQGSFRSDGVFEAKSFKEPSIFCAVCHG